MEAYDFFLILLTARIFAWLARPLNDWRSDGFTREVMITNSQPTG